MPSGFQALLGLQSHSSQSVVSLLQLFQVIQPHVRRQTSFLGLILGPHQSMLMFGCTLLPWLVSGSQVKMNFLASGENEYEFPITSMSVVSSSCLSPAPPIHIPQLHGIFEFHLLRLHCVTHFLLVIMGRLLYDILWARHLLLRMLVKWLPFWPLPPPGPPGCYC